MDYAPKVEFELEEVEPMTFEERMKGEKAMVGYPVSGHPLEGIEDFIKSKSKNLGAVEAWFEKLHNTNNSDDENSENTNPEKPPVETEKRPEKSEEKNSEKPKKEKKEDETATLIGFVSEVRHIPTKTGGQMIIATAESAGFNFTIAVFPRDYEIYANKILEDHIVVVNGKLRFDGERGEVSLAPFGRKNHVRFSENF